MEPMAGVDIMQEWRGRPTTDLTNGPGELTEAFDEHCGAVA
ncbi:MAG: hypothetical protein ABEJ00_02580 [Gemmatimonadota bacterium]